MFDLFDVPWRDLKRSDVEAFLDDAGEEGVTWEAKGKGRERDCPRPDTLLKAVCGLANQIGGYLILGASRNDDKWTFDGVKVPDDEPGLWIGRILRRLQPVPRFEVSEIFDIGEDNVAFVVKVEPVSAPPCMTPQGRVYERVSGETRPVEDPVLLDRLLRRGEQARGRAENYARRAAERAIVLPEWIPQRSVSIAVGLASVGRETEDISSRLFTGATHEAITKSIWALVGEAPLEQIDVYQRQDAYTALAHSAAYNHYDIDGETVIGVNRSSYFLQANWDGSVSAGAWFSDESLEDAIYPEEVVARCWREAATMGQILGGYGPAHLYILVIVAKSGEVEVVGQVARIAGRPPPGQTLYSRLPARTEMGRLLDAIEPDDETTDSLRRELRRAGGIRTDESE